MNSQAGAGDEQEQVNEQLVNLGGPVTTASLYKGGGGSDDSEDNK